ncbi:hypothetical protein ACFJGV_15160 [Cnuibacter sp. UC19_7]|uniref:phage tail tube protein n=1 Tax=Cnuibacter sp. UC19_7 TaxID=3350166 RepID=UPI00366B1690
MAGDATTLVVPGHGTVFTAAANTAMPATGLEAFSLAGTPPTGWTSLGHTSKQNTVAFSTDGGDASSLGTWLEDAVRTIYAATNWALTVNGLQVDKPTLDLSFNGGFDEDDGYIVPGSNAGKAVAMFVLCQDGSGQLGFYIPNTSTKLGSAPSIDTENFFELPLSSNILSASTSVIPALPDGRSGIMKIYKTGLEAPGA